MMKPRFAAIAALTSARCPDRSFRAFAAPGRKIRSSCSTKSTRLARDFRGDPGSALLEVLDPEQNATFRDNYLDVAFDLSKVLFITTANMLDPIAEPLRDRMEIIELPGYTEDEKIQIAASTSFRGRSKRTASRPIRSNLRMMRCAPSSVTTRAKRVSETWSDRSERSAANMRDGFSKAKTDKLVVTTEIVQEFLGGTRSAAGGRDCRAHEAAPALWLAWPGHRSGGDILFVEANKMKGNGSFTMTGQIGQVMQESMQAALTWVRSNATGLGFGHFYKDHDIHIHVPAGAIPKDGPSAGVTMATALVSLLTGSSGAATDWR